MSSSLSIILIVILDDSLTTVVPRYQVTAGLGFALHLHLIVISVPVSFGIILGFSTKDGANPAASSPPEIRRKIKISFSNKEYKTPVSNLVYDRTLLLPEIYKNLQYKKAY